MRKPILYICLLIAGLPGPAGISRAYAQLLPVRNYTTREGLNADGVYAVLRDSRGLLWVGTNNGISWYDGVRFVQPALNTRSGQVYVTSISEDSQKDIWITSWYSGIYHYTHGKFINYLPDTVHIESQANSVFDWLELGGGRYLAATDQNLWLFDGSHFRRFDPGNALLDQQINSVARTSRGDILIGYGSGLLVYEPDGGGWKSGRRLLRGEEVNHVFVKGEDAWLATSKGVYQYKWMRPETDPKIVCPMAGATRVLMDGRGTLWFTGDKGVHKLSQGQLTSYTSENGLPSDKVNGIYADQEGITWLGTDNGLAKFSEDDYRFYPLRDTKQFDLAITAIGQDEHGELWLGSFDGLYHMHAGQFREYRLPDAGSAGFIPCIFVDRQRHLWVGSSGGLYLIREERLELKSKIRVLCMGDDQADSAASPIIRRNDPETAGNAAIWMGCEDGSIMRLENGQLKREAMPLKTGEKVSAIYRDRLGYLWVGYPFLGVRKYRVTDQGLVLVRSYSSDNGYSNLRVRSFCADQTGHLLVGTRTNGLYIFDLTRDEDSVACHLNLNTGLSGNWVKSVAAAGDKVYLATNGGLDMLNCGDYGNPAIQHIPFRNENIPVELNCVIRHGDTLWLGTGKGLLEYLPGRRERDTMAPPVCLLNVTIGGKPLSGFVPCQGEYPVLALPYEQDNIALDFAGFSFRDEQSLHYRYRLEGADNNWSAVTDRRYVNYSQLSPGKYKFSVIAQNNDGVWSRSPATFAFTIASPFWRTPWFLGLCIVFVGAMIYLLYRYRLRQLLKIERLRSKIATDLHDDIGSTLSSISIMSDMILHSEGRPFGADGEAGVVEGADDAGAGGNRTAGTKGGVTSAMAREIRENSLSLMDKMDDIVWSINPRNDELENLMARIRRFAAQLFEARGIDYEIEIADELRHIRLPMDARQHIYLIMKEAINNLVKYSAAGRAGIRASSAGSLLKVEISDDGRGFDPDRLRGGGNGITNMKNRAEKIGAHLQLVSAPGRGTQVILTVRV